MFRDNQVRLLIFGLAYNLQPAEPIAAVGDRASPALIAEEAAEEADQDRSKWDAALQLRHVPTGQGGSHRSVFAVILDGIVCLAIPPPCCGFLRSSSSE